VHFGKSTKLSTKTLEHQPTNINNLQYSYLTEKNKRKHYKATFVKYIKIKMTQIVIYN